MRSLGLSFLAPLCCLATISLFFIESAVGCKSTKKCPNNACKNGGKLKSKTRHSCSDSWCSCPGGFEGKCCEKRIDWCGTKSCKNDATCTDGFQDKRKFECSCPEGFEGATCDTATDECRPNPCLHGGTCIDKHVAFECVCPEGTVGKRCEINFDDCVKHRCRNGGRCVDGVNGYTCECPDEWSGNFCEEHNFCLTASCSKKGGICTNLENGTTCTCKKGWAGEDCDQVGADRKCHRVYGLNHHRCHYGRRIWCKPSRRHDRRWACAKTCARGKKFFGIMGYWGRPVKKGEDFCEVFIGKKNGGNPRDGTMPCSTSYDCIKHKAALTRCANDKGTPPNDC